MGVRNTLKKAATGEADQERCVILGHYIVENNATVRAAAKKFGVSKSTVHQDITAKLAQVDRHLHDLVGKQSTLGRQAIGIPNDKAEA
ncbi:MAG: sporulation transcriptional regulator SpoIIID [Oscillospiraceae bacterium]